MDFRLLTGDLRRGAPRVCLHACEHTQPECAHTF